MAHRSQLSAPSRQTRSTYGATEGLRVARSQERHPRSHDRSKRYDLAAGTLWRATIESEASPRVQSGNRKIRTNDSDGSGQCHPKSNQMAAIARPGFEEQHLCRLDYGRS